MTAVGYTSFMITRKRVSAESKSDQVLSLTMYKLLKNASGLRAFCKTDYVTLTLTP